MPPAEAAVAEVRSAGEEIIIDSFLQALTPLPSPLASPARSAPPPPSRHAIRSAERAAALQSMVQEIDLPWSPQLANTGRAEEDDALGLAQIAGGQHFSHLSAVRMPKRLADPRRTPPAGPGQVFV